MRKSITKRSGKLNTLSLKDFDFENYYDLRSLKQDSEFEDFPFQTKEPLMSEVIRSALNRFGRDNGITASDCSKLTGISEPVTRRLLEKLCLIRDAYSTKIGKTTVYYPNGQPLHALGTHRIEDSLPYIIEAVLSKGPKGKMLIHLTEKRYSILDGEKVEGGVVIPVEYVDKLIRIVKSLKERSDSIGD